MQHTAAGNNTEQQEPAIDVMKQYKPTIAMARNTPTWSIAGAHEMLRNECSAHKDREHKTVKLHVLRAQNVKTQTAEKRMLRAEKQRTQETQKKHNNNKRNLQHFILTSKMKVGCEALSSFFRTTGTSNDIM